MPIEQTTYRPFNETVVSPIVEVDDPPYEYNYTCEQCEEGCDTVRRVSFHVNLRLVSQLWCEECQTNHSFVCESCDGRFHANEHYSDGLCESCYNQNQREDDSEDGVIDNYNAEVSIKPIGTPPHFMGVELEVENYREGKYDNASDTKNSLGEFAIIKSDGSLDNGFEIVTRPATLEEHEKRWPSFFGSSVVANLRSWNTSTCGLHVHASRLTDKHVFVYDECITVREASYDRACNVLRSQVGESLDYDKLKVMGQETVLGDLTVAKIVCFVNAAHNRRFMEIIAGRSSGSYTSFKAKKLGDSAKTNPNRYEAVNLQNNNTIEFRIFKGTLKQASVFKAIEFVDALIRFCKPASRSLRDSLSRARFCEYVKKNKKTYPHLVAFLDAKWFGIETEDTKKYNFRIQNNENEEN